MNKIILLIFLSLSSLTRAEVGSNQALDATQFTQECHDFENTRGHYCVNRVKGSTSNDIIYFFHGLMMKPQDWPMEHTVYEMVSKNWFKLGAKAPIVVSISYGPIWLALEKNPGSQLSGRRDEVANTIIPGIEKSLGIIPTSRTGFGASMGGFNLTQVTLQYPKLFNRVALVCPAILNISPFASISEGSEFIQRAQRDGVTAKRLYLSLYQILGISMVPTSEEWENVSVFNLLRKNRRPLPPLYISTGRSDQFGFFEGSQDFVKILQQQNRNVSWYPTEGGHCSFDEEALSKFIFPSADQ